MHFGVFSFRTHSVRRLRPDLSGALKDRWPGGNPARPEPDEYGHQKDFIVAFPHQFHRSAYAARFLTAGVVLVGSSVLLAGCEKTQSPTPTTVGEKLDAAIDKTRAVAADVKVEAQTAYNDAQKRVEQDAPRVQDRAQTAATTAGRVIDDVAITAQISTGLARDPELSALKIDVDTKDGVVILRGPAPTASARERAGMVARGITGVVSVDNQLVVKAG
ncbi:BON domain-containing protein [Xylophilus sp. Kf1]|nr:BON domain-containing protein [Xylophilus sp. Kf1]